MSGQISVTPQNKGVARLRQLRDVSSQEPITGQALVYGTNNEWEPQTITPDLSAIEADITTLQTDLDTAESDIAAAESDIVDILADVADLTTDVGTVTSDLATHEADTSNPHAVTFAQIGAFLTASQTGTGLGVSTTLQDVPGMSVVCPTAGTYLFMIVAEIDFDLSSGTIRFALNNDGVDGTEDAWYEHNEAVSGQQFAFFMTATTTGVNKTVKLRARESSSAASTVQNEHTRMYVIKVS